MPYTAPTVTDFQTRFPEFEDTDEAVITAALEDASRFVDENWDEADYQTAIMLLAAHYVQLSGGSYDTSGLKSISLGTISVTYKDGSSEQFGPDATSYGQRFKNLLFANRRGPRVA